MISKSIMDISARSQNASAGSAVADQIKMQSLFGVPVVGVQPARPSI